MDWGKFTSEALSEVQVRPVERSEEERYQEQMARHHYLGALAKLCSSPMPHAPSAIDPP